jgi:hypothetical protein
MEPGISTAWAASPGKRLKYLWGLEFPNEPLGPMGLSSSGCRLGPFGHLFPWKSAARFRVDLAGRADQSR